MDTLFEIISGLALGFGVFVVCVIVLAVLDWFYVTPGE